MRHVHQVDVVVPFEAFGRYAADTLIDKEASLRAYVAGLAETIDL